MGNPKANDGTIFRSDLDGRNMTTIIAPGGIFTPKQLQIDKLNGKLYWSDREGMRVMRAPISTARGSRRSSIRARATLDPEPIQSSGAVGVAIDLDAGKFYWTQKGGDNAGEGSILAREPRYTEGSNADEPHGISNSSLRQAARADRPRFGSSRTRRLYRWTDRG